MNPIIKEHKGGDTKPRLKSQKTCFRGKYIYTENGRLRLQDICVDTGVSIDAISLSPELLVTFDFKVYQFAILINHFIIHSFICKLLKMHLVPQNVLNAIISFKDSWHGIPGFLPLHDFWKFKICFYDMQSTHLALLVSSLTTNNF